MRTKAKNSDTASFWLSPPFNATDSLNVLALAGLSAEPLGSDYRITGHERWNLADTTKLLGWLRLYGEWVKKALCPETNQH